MHANSEDEQQKGNLGLCQGISCLTTAPTGEGLLKSRLQEGFGDSAIKWRFEDGLLRALDTDGFATDRCLGPNVSTIVDVAGGQVAPYELALQDCPEPLSENIFAHDFIKHRTVEDETRVDELGRHMRFLVLGDGRIQSLAPVRGSHSAFCVSAMNWDGLGVTNAYLTPCLDDLEEDDQVFSVDPGSSFESFLLNWQTDDERIVEFAYQLGYEEAFSNPEAFESYAIKITTNDDSSFLSATILPGGSTPKSGTLSLSLDDLNAADTTKVVGRLEAHLLGISLGGLESRWLASTAFDISESAYDVEQSLPFSPHNADDNYVGRIGEMVDDENVTEVAKGFPKSMIALVCFLGFMAFYLILVKANSIFCPNKRTQNQRRMRNRRRHQEKRDSEHTTATMEDAVHRMMNGEADWMRTSLDSMGSILFRINEELDDEDIEEVTSTDGEEPITASDTTSDTAELDISGNDVETSQ